MLKVKSVLEDALHDENADHVKKCALQLTLSTSSPVHSLHGLAGMFNTLHINTLHVMLVSYHHFLTAWNVWLHLQRGHFSMMNSKNIDWI